ncbi:MAG: cytochrome b/b6 domain-containing protein, partial [Humibacter sp.]
MATHGSALRRGLPRVPGGQPWPPAGIVAEVNGGPADAPITVTEPVPSPAPVFVQDEATPTGASAAPALRDAASVATPAGARPLRRGLPRVAGGEPWPPAGFVPTASPSIAVVTAEADAAPAATTETSAIETSTDSPPESAASTDPAGAAIANVAPRTTPLPLSRTAWAGQAGRARPAAKPAPKRIGPFTRGQWVGAIVVGGAGLVYAAAMAVFAVRWLLSTPWGVDFLAAYPGEYHLPAGAPVGFPAWLGWQHFFNVFL